MLQGARRILGQKLLDSRILPSEELPRGMVETFDQLPAASLFATEIASQPPPFTTPRTVQTKPNDFFTSFVAQPFPERQIRVAAIPRASLLGDGGAVFTEDGRLVFESLWDKYQFERDFSTVRRVRKPEWIAGRHASLISLWHYNYYHWMVDALPRLAVLEAVGLNDVNLIVPEPLQPWQLEMLDRVGVARNRLSPFMRQHVRSEELIWAAAPAQINFVTPFVVQWLRQRLRRSEPKVAERLVYIRRSQSRRLENEAGALGLLQRFGFETVQPETLSVAAQIELFASVRAIVAVHGAATANAMFSDRLSLLELFQPGFITAPFFTLAGAAGWDYWYLECEPAELQGSVKPRDLRVSLDALEATVTTMLAEL